LVIWLVDALGNTVCKVLHRHPSLSPHLLALSIRTHLALSHTLSVKTPISISQDPSLASRMNEEVMRNLEDSMLIENNGVRGGWVGLIAGQEVIFLSYGFYDTQLTRP
jgi:hypothetical protein